jgi:hypothetical protein
MIILVIKFTIVPWLLWLSVGVLCCKNWIYKGHILLWRNSPTRDRVASFLRVLDHRQWHTTVGRTPLDEGSARRRNLYLTTHKTHTHSMPPAGFEPAIPASEQLQTLTLDRSAKEHIRQWRSQDSAQNTHNNAIVRILKQYALYWKPQNCVCTTLGTYWLFK